MQVSEKEYDFVIIGSGLGGLSCGYILSKEGYSVVILEKNRQLGGTLQIFSRDQSIFDTGVHYIGSLDDGQSLNQFFKFFGLLGIIKLKRMDENGYDVIRFADGKEYRHGQGYENFKRILINDFPDEAQAIHTFCDKMQEICRHFPLYYLENGINPDYLSQDNFRELNAYEYIASLTSDKRLQNVLAGSNPLYAGVKEKTPFYVHSLIMNSYINGAYKLVDGGSQIVNVLSRQIRQAGGEILKGTNVAGANFRDDGTVREVVLENGETVKGKNFISNMHPAVTIDVFGEKNFLKAYTKRIKSLENTLSTFIVHISLHENTFEYLNHNIYQYNMEDVWDGVNYTDATWPDCFFICTPATSKSEKYADALSVMTYMKMDEMAKWSKTHNTTAKPGLRGSGYEEFKKEKEEKVLEKIEELFPDIRSKIKNVYSSTPLTFRDYTGNYDGSLYGIIKDSHHPVRSFVHTKTKIPNLFLTGQNIIFHGILGVTIGAFVTCFEFVDKDRLIEKVRKA